MNLSKHKDNNISEYYLIFHKCFINVSLLFFVLTKKIVGLHHFNDTIPLLLFNFF